MTIYSLFRTTRDGRNSGATITHTGTLRTAKSVATRILDWLEAELAARRDDARESLRYDK